MFDAYNDDKMIDNHGRVAESSSDGDPVFKTLGQSIARGTHTFSFSGDRTGQNGEVSFLLKKGDDMPDLKADTLKQSLSII